MQNKIVCVTTTKKCSVIKSNNWQSDTLLAQQSAKTEQKAKQSACKMTLLASFIEANRRLRMISSHKNRHHVWVN